MEDRHGVAEERLGVEIGRAVSGEEVAEVERERRVGDAVAVRRARRQLVVAPALVLGRLEKEEVDSVRRSGAVVDAIGRLRGNFDGSVEDAVESIFGDAILQEIFAGPQ